jgi:hypothetical protein
MMRFFLRVFIDSGFRAAGFSQNQVNLLCPGPPEGLVHSVPTSETEQQGMGGAIRGMLGGALGVARGLELGMVATALIPGVGSVLAVGMAAAAVLGTGGAIAGAAAGAAVEERTTHGVPEDEIFFYEDALRQGRSVVLVLAENDTEEKCAQADGRRWRRKPRCRQGKVVGGIAGCGEEHYHSTGRNFEKDHDACRAGFEAAQRRESRGKSMEEMADRMKWWQPDVWDSEPFRRGFERGREYQLQLQNHETFSR